MAGVGCQLKGTGKAVRNYARGGDVQPPKTKKYFRPTKSGAGMTKAGVARYRRENPGSKLSTAVTEDNPGPKRAASRSGARAWRQIPGAASPARPGLAR